MQIKTYFFQLIGLFIITSVSPACFYDIQESTLLSQVVYCSKNVDCPERQGCYALTKQCIPITSECIRNTNNQLIAISDGDSCSGQGIKNGICRRGTCKESTCGDDFFNKKEEECDDGNDSNSDDCTNQCRIAKCGDGFLSSNEICDDGNTLSGDGCRNDCAKIEVCGDSIIDANEECDDGNNNPNDRCDQCNTVTWNSSIVTGLGEHMSSPKQQPLPMPTAVFVSLDESIYIANRCQIFKMSPDHKVMTVIAGQEICGFSGDGGHATNAKFHEITSIFVTPHSEIYISDTSNQRIRKINKFGIVSTIAGKGEEVYGYIEGGFSGDNDLARTAELDAPDNVFVQDGKVYIGDRNNRRIRMIDENGIITTIAGNGEDNDDLFVENGLGIENPVVQPSSLYFYQNELYFVDNYSSTLRKIRNDGTIKTVYQSEDSYIGKVFVHDDTFYFMNDESQGIFKFNDDGSEEYLVSRESNANLYLELDTKLINSFFVTSEGVFFTAYERNNLWFVSHTNPVLESVAGNGLHIIAKERTSIQNTEIRNIEQMVLSEGVIYFTDISHSGIRRLNADQTVTTVLGTTIEELPFLDEESSFNGYPIMPVFGIHDGKSYIFDSNSTELKVIDALGNVSSIYTPEELINADGLAFSGSDIYLSSWSGNKIYKSSQEGEFQLFAGNGENTYSDDYVFNGDGGLAINAGLNSPVSPCFYNGDLYFVDEWNYRVRKVNAQGIISTVAGGGDDVIGENIQATDAKLEFPVSVFVDESGIYISDLIGWRLRHVTFEGRITTIAGNGINGFSGDGGPALDASFEGMFSIYKDETGIYFMDQINNRIRMIDNDQIMTTVVGNSVKQRLFTFEDAELISPKSLVRINDHTLFSANEKFNTIQKIDFLNQMISPALGYEGGFKINEDPFAAVENDTSYNRQEYFRLLNNAAGIAYNGSDTLYISEENSGNILALHMPSLERIESWSVRLFAGAVGQQAIRNGDLQNALFHSPSALAFDFTENNLYVAESSKHIIRKIDLDSGMVSTVFGHEDVAAPFDTYLNTPSGIAVAKDSSIYISDQKNHRIIRLLADGSHHTILGSGEEASSGDGSPSTLFPINSPKNLTLDSFGNLYITSTTSIRMLSANDQGLIEGKGEVMTLYGQAPRLNFPENTTQCLSGIVERSPGIINFTDLCQGYLIELQKVTSALQ